MSGFVGHRLLVVVLTLFTAGGGLAQVPRDPGEAAYNPALLLLQPDRGETSDPGAAAPWLEMASTNGRSAAQTILGRLYETDPGCPGTMDSPRSCTAPLPARAIPRPGWHGRV